MNGYISCNIYGRVYFSGFCNHFLRSIMKCRICRTEFQRRSISHKTCSIDCALAYVAEQNAKKLQKKQVADRKDTKLALAKLKTRSEWAKETEAVVNKYVRLRDAHLGCISCDKGPNWDGQWHASHYKSVGSNSALRFNLFNIHKSCSVCNNWKSGNIGDYTPRLIMKLGKDRVDWLDNHPRSREYSIEYLQRLKSIFLRKIKRITLR